MALEITHDDDNESITEAKWMRINTEVNVTQQKMPIYYKGLTNIDLTLPPYGRSV